MIKNEIHMRVKKLTEKSKIKKQLGNTRGSATIELVAEILVLLFLLAVFINVLPVFLKIQTMNYIANETLRMAEVTGSPDSSEVIERMNELFDAAKVDPSTVTTSWEGTEYMSVPNQDKVQINKKIKFTISYQYHLMGNRLKDKDDTGVNLPFTAVSTGRSEVYIKVK